jgi:hypothetical protein
MMIRQILIGLLWLSFTVYAFGFAPGDSPATIELIKKLSTMDVAGVNPAIVYLFNLMGVLPMMYGCMLYADGRNQKLPAWAFLTGSFFLGAFALLPYMALRQDNPGFVGEKDWFLKIWESKVTAVLIAVGAVVLLTLGLTQADWPDFWQQWHSSKFIHVMSLDFCMLSLVFPVLLRDDMERRGLQDGRVFWAVALLPLVGALGYLVFRPGLVVGSEDCRGGFSRDIVVKTEK